MPKLPSYSVWQKIRLFFLGDPGLPEEKWAELEKLRGPDNARKRAVWYMNNLYPRRSVGFFTTQRPLQSPRMALMLADPDVGPIVRQALKNANYN